MVMEMQEIDLGAELVSEDFDNLKIHLGIDNSQTFMLLLLSELREMNINLANLELNLRRHNGNS